MFEGQCDLEAQGLGHHVSNLSVILYDQTQFKFEGKIPNHSEVITFTRNHTDHVDDDRTKHSDMLFTSVKVASSWNGMETKCISSILV